MNTQSDDQPLTIALTKGRILQDTLPLLARCGLNPVEDPERSRRLIFESKRPGIRFVLLRGADVVTYVRQGAADAGVVGKDMLLEYGAAGLYEPLDLGLAKCSLQTAGFAAGRKDGTRLRVASKFVNVARSFYAAKGVQADIIKLYGAMELAPMLGLVDEIVDIVDTGNTLRANGLVPFEHIADISTRFVVNKAAMRTRHALLTDIIGSLGAVSESS